jgi:hypothetical protein
MKNIGRVFITVLILVWICYTLFEFLFLKEDYENYEKCGTNKVKWENCINSLVDAAVDDIKDGIWNDSEFHGWKGRRKDITDYINNNIGDEMLRVEINQIMTKKLNNLNNEYPKIEGVREKVMERFDLQFE